MWSEQSAKDKQPYEQKAAKLKEKYEKVHCLNLLKPRYFLNKDVRSWYELQNQEVQLILYLWLSALFGEGLVKIVHLRM